MRRLAFEATLGCQAPISASIVHELNVREERWKKVTWGKIIVDRITARGGVVIIGDHISFESSRPKTRSGPTFAHHAVLVVLQNVVAEDKICRRVTVGDDHVTGVLNGIVFNRD